MYFDSASSSSSSYKAACERDDRLVSKKDTVRTHTLLENVFAYMVREKCDFYAKSTMNRKEKEIFQIYKRALDFVGDAYCQKVRRECTKLDVITKDSVDTLLCTIADELFSDGITWSRITAFFVFVKELTLWCIYKKVPTSIVDVIVVCFSELVEEKLKPWIEDHGNWDGISSIYPENENSMLPSKSSCVKLLLLTAIKAFGIFSSVSNVVNNTIS